MDERFLKLSPIRYLCPYCGEWHEWEQFHELGFYNSSSYKAKFECCNSPTGCNSVDYSVYFESGMCYYSTERMCRRADQSMSGSIPISSIMERSDEPIVIFDVEFTSNSDVGRCECCDCGYRNKCNCVKLGDKGDHRHMKIPFGFMFEQSDYDKIYKEKYLAKKEQELQERENALRSKEEELQARENAINFDAEKLAIMSAMCGQPAEGGDQNASMNQLLALMLFKGDMGGDDDMMKMLLMSSMMGAQTEGGDQNASMNQLLPLMLISKKDTGNDDMTKMLLMSIMMGGNSSSNNVIGYLIMHMLMSEKDKKEENPAPQTQE